MLTDLGSAEASRTAISFRGVGVGIQVDEVQESENGFGQTKAALKELVDLRNDRVHHLIERFNLRSAAPSQGQASE